MAKVVIDPICVSLSVNDIPLSAINLNLANWIHTYLRQVLNANEIEMTRTTNEVCVVPIETRLGIASKSDVQVIVSVGADNFSTDTTVNGFEIFHGGSSNGISLANGVFQQTANLRTKWNLGVRFGGPVQVSFDFAMITDTIAPAVLVMPGFMSNATDFNALTNYNFQQEFGFAIAQAISSYLGLGTLSFEETTPSPIPEPTPTTAPISPLPFLIAGAAVLGIVIAMLVTKK